MKKCPQNIHLKVIFFYNFIILLLFIIDFNIIIIYYARQILFLQPDFLLQKSAIEEIIMDTKEAYIKY